MPTHYLQTYFPHQQYGASAALPGSQHTIPFQHLGYGHSSQNPPSFGPLHAQPPLRSVQPGASQSTIRLASPQPPNLWVGGPLKEQWGRMDRMTAKSYADLRDGACKSANKMTSTYIEKPTHLVTTKSMQALCHGAALCDRISSKFDEVITSIDCDRYDGKDQHLMIDDDQQQPADRARDQPTHAVVGADKRSNRYTKVWLYKNSRLPPHMPPFKVFMPTYPLLCLAATYSERVYDPPRSNTKEMETHVPADWYSGTKAMVLKSLPVDDMNTVVFAIRGSQLNFMDWAVNYNSAPTSPEGFLEDPKNLCHAGFLYVAKKMIKPVADRLRVLLQENPARSNCSLLITGHSAGGAVAALLYAHMMSNQVESELSDLTGFFKRVHCITFGAPPISTWPLQKTQDKRHRKSLFYSFINEGDPVPRADKPYVKSLLKLYRTSAPTPSTIETAIASVSKLSLSQPLPKPKTKYGFIPRLARPSKTAFQAASSAALSMPEWPLPTHTLSPAGRLLVLRPKIGGQSAGLGEIVEAVTVDDVQLRGVMYGDPEKHQMKLYKERIDEIATRAVTAGGY
jgi:hypothetical protein